MSKTSARSIADVTKRSVLARVDIAAPPDRVWKAITEDVAKWWGSDEMYRTTKHTVDLRRGGGFRSEGVGADGHAFHVSGEILELEPPHRYVTTWQPSWSTEPASRVTYLLEPIATGTRVTVEHSGFTSAESCESHGSGWERVLDWLAGHLRGAKKYFMCRLLPPRPSFMLDMTADERAVMKAHGEYWRGKLAEGSVIAFGPVADPSGGYGLGLVAADDEAAVRVFEANDPAIKSERGFRYEHVPMAALVH
jgi:uncharacterized protein YndB with AHSA1/START domain/uncharacterized protein YciI